MPPSAKCWAITFWIWSYTVVFMSTSIVFRWSTSKFCWNRNCGGQFKWQKGKPRYKMVIIMRSLDQCCTFLQIQKFVMTILTWWISCGSNFNKYNHPREHVSSTCKHQEIQSFCKSLIEAFCGWNIKKSRYTKSTSIQKYYFPIVTDNSRFLEMCTYGIWRMDNE